MVLRLEGQNQYLFAFQVYLLGFEAAVFGGQKDSTSFGNLVSGGKFLVTVEALVRLGLLLFSIRNLYSYHATFD
jgi:hypothetical protein